MLNTITGGFVWDGETSSARKRYAFQVLNIEGLPRAMMKDVTRTLEIEIAFSKKDAGGIHPFKNDSMVIIFRCDD